MSSALSISAQAAITSGPRTIKSGVEYDKYFPKPDERDGIIIEDGEVQDTVGLMEKVVHKYLVDTARIAPVLKRASLQETCRNIWQFIYKHWHCECDVKTLNHQSGFAKLKMRRTFGIFLLGRKFRIREP